MIHQMLISFKVSRAVLIFFMAVLMSLSIFMGYAESSNSVTATKTKNPGGTYSTGGTSTFTLGTAQTVTWQANYTDTSPTAGNDFYVHDAAGGAPLNQYALSTNLSSGLNTDTYFFNAGTYVISTNFFGMGAGSYTIIYDQTASIGVSPTSHDFGAELTGNSSSAFTFTINSTGDLPVTISSVTSSDPAHFQVTGVPAGQQVPPNKTFQVRFNAGATPGSYGATVTVHGTSSLGPLTATANVSGETLPRDPNITCSGTPSLGSADYTTGEVITGSRLFSNTGTENLVITSITVVNDSPGSAFTANGAPSLSPLGQGNSRSVSIRFAPPLAGGEATYTGHLQINSNDPDEPTKNCAFTAIAHHPVPIVHFNETTLNYGDVELGFSYTKAIIVRNDGDAPLIITINDSPADPDLGNYPSRETGGPITINPGASERIYRQVYSPQATGGPHTIVMNVTSNDLTNTSQNITLTGNGISPIAIDSVLVLDRSGSMSDPAGSRRKIDAMQTAGSLFTDLLRPTIPSAANGDKLGFVRYNHVNDEYLSLGFIDDGTPGSHLDNARGKISVAAVADNTRLGPTGNTGIGGAMQRAAGMLVASPADRKHVMVVLTDGKENVAPWISDVIGPIQAADSDIMMYSIGLGSNTEPVKLQSITNISNGYHQVTDDLSGTSIFDLEAFYFKIFSNATGMSLVVDPTYPVMLSGAAPIIVEKAKIISSDRSATFLVLENPPMRAFYDLEFVSPKGNVIVLGSSVAGTPVHVLQRYNYTIYKVIFPAVDQAPKYVGNWILRLTPNGKWSKGAVDEAIEKQRYTGTDFIDPRGGMVPIGFAAAVASDYRMAVEVNPSNYLPGADITLLASLTDRGWPATNGKVDVAVTTPTGAQLSVKLYDNGTHGDAVSRDGTWTNHFIQTGVSGSYKFFFKALGENERGELAPREDTRYATLMKPSDDPTHRDEPCLSCKWQKWLWTLVVVLLLLIFYCCCLKKRLFG